jgi:Glycosyltransferase like family
MNAPRATVSIVCVYNNLAVRQQCLDRSIEHLDAEGSDVEYLPIDNVNGSFPCAGAALNHGASRASGDVVAFVHQDVFLHSLTALKGAAGQMMAGGFGVLGAVGIRSDGQLVGRVRDRVVLLGDAVASPSEVDSVDEVLFMVPRQLLLREPLTESSDMAWHAYAVEYGLRVQRLGLRTGVADIPLTHNSLTVNLDRLDEAHQAVAACYGDMLPIRTTCGVISRTGARTRSGTILSSQRWRYPWFRESLAIRQSRAAGEPTAAVLADIRRDVDDVVDRSPERRLHIVNRSQGPRFVDGKPSPLELVRRNGYVVIASHDISDVPAALTSKPDGQWLLLTNLSRLDLEALGSRLPARPGVLGFHTGIGFWYLLGAPLTDLPPQWSSKRATPLGKRSLAAAATG